VMTARTTAVVPVHLFGNVAPVDELADLGVAIVEDSAQAAGATYRGRRAGSLGTAATFSFFPSKNLPCLGDGGAVVTDDDEVAALARRLRFHGSEDKRTFTEVGYNSRLDELQAAVLRLLLPELDGWNERRRAVAAAYERLGLGEFAKLPGTVDGAEHVYHLYVVQGERLAGVGTGYYRVPCHLQPAMREWGADSLELPGTREAAQTNVALPMGKDLTEGQIEEVVRSCASGST
jgi:dTDP-4-amino-4,6-dideoxygalactose transaminase